MHATLNRYVIATLIVTAAAFACEVGEHPRVLWRFTAFEQRFWHGYCDSTEPVLSGDRLYVGNGYAWDDATYLFALDTRTGRELWRAPTGGLFFGAKPVVDGAFVTITTQDVHQVQRLMVFSTADGRRIWSRSRVSSRWTVADGTTYVDDGSALAALDTATGRQIWRVANRNILQASPVVAGDYVYFGGGRPPQTLLYAVDRRKGLYVGEAQSLPGFNGRLAASEGRVFAEAGLEGRRVTYEWVGDSKSARVRREGLVALQGQVAYFVKGEGILNAVDVATGGYLWSRPGLARAALGGVIIDQDVFYQIDMRSHDFVRAYDLSNGTEWWNFASGDWLAPLAMSSDGVFVSSDDCTVVALRRGR